MNNPFKFWWLILIKGIILIILAFISFFQPETALLGLAFYLGFSLLLAGFFQVLAALVNRKIDDNFRGHLTIGIVDILFAIILLTNLNVTAAIFPFIVGFWTIVYGVMLFVNSLQVKKAGEKNWWIEGFGGFLNVVIGYLIMSNMTLGALSITFWMGLGFLFFGMLSIWIALRLRKL